MSSIILKILFLLIILLGAGVYPLKAQLILADKEIDILPVPAIGYSPETKTYLGAVSLFTFRNRYDSITRSSNAKIEFNYTWNKQIILESDWNWFSPGEEWFSTGLVHYSKYPDLYYGIGFDTPSSNEVIFESKRFILDFNLFRNIKNNSFLGGGVNFTSYSNINFSPLDEVSIWADTSSFGLKGIYLHDSRNNILSPSSGKYFVFTNSFNFGETFYFKTSADYRRYFNWEKNKSYVLAGRFYHESVLGDPPFYDYPMLGGDEYLRGYYLGRFRDKNLSFVQLEFRSVLFWRIGLAGFGGLAMIYDKINNIRYDSFKPNIGGGLRFLVDKNEKTSLRLDYALGAGKQSGFYISFGESF